MNRTTRIIGLLAIAGLLGLACGVGPILPTATAASTVTPEPTATPELIYGVDFPAVISGLQMSCGGINHTGASVEVTLRGVSLRENVSLNETSIVDPRGGYIFVELLASLSSPQGCLDTNAIADSMVLECQGASYLVEYSGLRVTDGHLSGFTFTFEIQEATDIAQCELFPQGGGTPVPLWPVLEAP